ncbi:MAG: GvpL/GvpF family gas vesicle protein [Methylovulum sp.]|nr:GvpL/GvpF family gas vesicle protein [Methylovulum sp.]
MSVMLYGIVAAEARLVLGSELHGVKAAGLTAIVSTVAAEISREAAAVLAYGEQVQHIHQQTTLIPTRYGNVLADGPAVAAHLHAHEVRYRAQLAELENCEEMGIRLVLDTMADESAGAVSTRHMSGHDYLLARKRAYSIPEPARQHADLLNTALAGLYRQHRAELSLFNGQRTYLLSYLVPRTGLALFCQRLDVFSAGLTGNNASISGPWPLYNFANWLAPHDTGQSL